MTLKNLNIDYSETDQDLRETHYTVLSLESKGRDLEDLAANAVCRVVVHYNPTSVPWTDESYEKAVWLTDLPERTQDLLIDLMADRLADEMEARAESQMDLSEGEL